MSESKYDEFDLNPTEFDPDNIEDPIEPLNIPADRFDRRTHTPYPDTNQRDQYSPINNNDKPTGQQRTQRTETRASSNTETSNQRRQTPSERNTAGGTQPKPSNSTPVHNTPSTIDMNMDFSFFRDGRFSILMGVILLFTALYFTIVTISYFGTGLADQSVTSGRDMSQIDPSEVKNMGGVLGALLANTFMSRWVGVASFIIIAYIVCVGLALVKARKFNIPTLTIKSLACTIALSIVAGYISLHWTSGFHWGGDHGYYMNTMILGLMGEFGLLIVNLLIVACIIVLFLHELTVAVKLIAKKYHQFKKTVYDENRRRSEREQANRMANDIVDSEQPSNSDIRQKEPVNETPHTEPEPERYTSVTEDTVEDKPQEITQEEIHRPIVIEDEPTTHLPSPTPLPSRKLEDVAEEEPGDHNKFKPEPTSKIHEDFQIEDNIKNEYPAEQKEDILPGRDYSETANRSDDEAYSAPFTIPDLTELPEDDEEPLNTDLEPQQSEDTDAQPYLSDNNVTEPSQPALPLGSIGTKYDHRADLSRFRMPSLDLLHEVKEKELTIDAEQEEENKQRITQTLATFGISISRIEATIGPTVTLYEIVPAEGVRINRIRSLEDDIARSIAAKGTRIIAPIPGKETIGIEVPNKDPQIVPIRNILASDTYRDCKMELPMAVGATISNKVYIADLCKMPHLLVAGATGMGKSVGLNAILASLLYKKHPTEVKFVLVDPKQVEFSLYRKIENHYLAKIPGEENAIITDLQKVVPTLNSLCVEMENRYSLLTDASVRQITEYNRKFTSRQLDPDRGHRYMPYIVVVVDEFADLIMTVGKEVEQPIARLAQKARAVGIHLILATQRPSTNVITGIIKANFPGRIAFRVFQMVDSRTIIDRPGANQLIGKGDMLFSRDGVIDRVQCALIETDEVEAICQAIGDQVGFPEPYMLPESLDDTSDFGGAGTPNDVDPLFPEAARYVVTSGTASTSSLQTRYTIGYPRARKIMEQLENARIVGPAQGAKPRQVLVDSLALERILEMRNLN